MLGQAGTGRLTQIRVVPCHRTLSKPARCIGSRVGRGSHWLVAYPAYLLSVGCAVAFVLVCVWKFAVFVSAILGGSWRLIFILMTSRP